MLERVLKTGNFYAEYQAKQSAEKRKIMTSPYVQRLYAINITHIFVEHTKALIFFQETDKK